MISEALREWLYPLGLISTVAFTSRFLIQWLQSEKAKRSIVTPSFWWISIFGNLALGLHAFIQAQYPVCIVQAINGVIASRNLNLMLPEKRQWQLKTVVIALIAALAVPTLAFWLASFEDWVRVPTHAFQQTRLAVSPFWHFIGAAGVVLFASRFWVQWIFAELSHESTLDRSFWWLSLIGAAFSLLYFAVIADYINLAGPLFGMIPYLRNLMLLNKTKGVPA